GVSFLCLMGGGKPPRGSPAGRRVTGCIKAKGLLLGRLVGARRIIRRRIFGRFVRLFGRLFRFLAVQTRNEHCRAFLVNRVVRTRETFECTLHHGVPLFRSFLAFTTLASRPSLFLPPLYYRL